MSNNLVKGGIALGLFLWIKRLLSSPFGVSPGDVSLDWPGTILNGQSFQSNEKKYLEAALFYNKNLAKSGPIAGKSLYTALITQGLNFYASEAAFANPQDTGYNVFEVNTHIIKQYPAGTFLGNVLEKKELIWVTKVYNGSTGQYVNVFNPVVAYRTDSLVILGEKNSAKFPKGVWYYNLKANPDYLIVK